MKTTLALLLFILLSFPALAQGGTTGGPYVGLALGGQQISEMDISGTSYDVTFDPGWSVSGSVGYHWPIGLRLELEGSYLSSSIDKIKSGSASANLDGSEKMTALMVNALWEFENQYDWFTYLGLGAGYGWSTAEIEGDSASSSIPLAQPIIGIGYRLTQNVSMSLDYKYLMGLKKLDYDDTKSEYRAHRINLGLRYMF